MRKLAFLRFERSGRTTADVSTSLRCAQHDKRFWRRLASNRPLVSNETVNSLRREHRVPSKCNTAEEQVELPFFGVAEQGAIRVRSSQR